MAEQQIIYDLDGGRQPYSAEAEQSILGSILIDPKCLNDVAVQMKTEYFYIPQHQKIYEALSSMYELNQVIDFVALLDVFAYGTHRVSEGGGRGFVPVVLVLVCSGSGTWSA